MSTPYAIHWFRRDLRVSGNPALQWAAKKYNGKVLGLFCFDSNFLKRDDFSHNRFQFFLETLKVLKQEMLDSGSELLVIDSQLQEAFPKLLKQLKHAPVAVTWNRDYEPFARKRDGEVEKLLTKAGIEVHTETDHLIIEPHELLNFSKKDGPYQIYTPFSKVWLEMFKLAQIKNRIERQSKKSGAFSLKWKNLTEKNLNDSLEDFLAKNKAHVTVPIPKAGGQVALQKLKEFQKKVTGYSTSRDIPSVEGTSVQRHAAAADAA